MTLCKKISFIVLTLFTLISCSDKFSSPSERLNKTETKIESEKIESEEVKSLKETENEFSIVYEDVKDSIVNIRATKIINTSPYNPLEELLFGKNGTKEQERKKSGTLGSGFIVSDDGYILTNNHVIHGTESIYVKFSNGHEYPAKIVGTAPDVDVAVLKIEGSDNFKPLIFDNSDDIKIGQWAIAFGNALGLNNTMTVGIISALGRSSLGIEEIENFIQTDASINQGNSGGPLLNINGHVIGMNTAILSRTGGSIGIGFAIPSNLINTVKDSIIKTGSYKRPLLGIHIQNITDEIKEKYKLNSNFGAFVTDVIKSGPADKAGVKANDIIIEINEKNIKNPSALMAELAAHKTNDKINLKILRDGIEKEISLVIE